MLNPEPYRFSSFTSTKLTFKGVNSFYKRLERDKLFTEEPLPDFSVMDKNNPLKVQRDHATFSQERLAGVAPLAKLTRRMFDAKRQKNKNGITEEKLKTQRLKELQNDGLKIDPNASLDEMAILQAQFSSHQEDEESGMNYGVGSLSDPAVAEMKAFKKDPTSYSSKNIPNHKSIFSRMTDFFKNLFQRIKKWCKNIKQ